MGDKLSEGTKEALHQGAELRDAMRRDREQAVEEELTKASPQLHGVSRGQWAFGCGVHNDRVVMHFPDPKPYVGLVPEAAADVAGRVLGQVAVARSRSLEVHVSPDGRWDVIWR